MRFQVQLEIQRRGGFFWKVMDLDGRWNIPGVQVGEDQCLVEGDLSKELQQMLHLLLKHLVGQRVRLH